MESGYLVHVDLLTLSSCVCYYNFLHRNFDTLRKAKINYASPSWASSIPFGLKLGTVGMEDERKKEGSRFAEICRGVERWEIVEGVRGENRLAALISTAGSRVVDTHRECRMEEPAKVAAIYCSIYCVLLRTCLYCHACEHKTHWVWKNKNKKSDLLPSLMAPLQERTWLRFVLVHSCLESDNRKRITTHEYLSQDTSFIQHFNQMRVLSVSVEIN